MWGLRRVTLHAMTYPANPRARRLMEMATREDVDPAAELLEDRETPERGETAGHLHAGALAIPDLQNPWAAITGAMADQLEAGVARVASELIAALEPLPLVRFAGAAANADGVAVVPVEYVPPRARWECGHLHVSNPEMDAIDAEVFVDSGDAGGYRLVDAGAADADVGVTFTWPAMFLGEGHRIEVRASGLTAGAVLEVGLFGRIHSTR